MIRRLVALSLLMFAAGAAATAHGHGVSLWTEVQGEQLRIEVYASDGDTVPDARVTVRAMDGSVLASGTTRRDGVFMTPLPRASRVTVEAELDADHTARGVVTLAD